MQNLQHDVRNGKEQSRDSGISNRIPEGGVKFDTLPDGSQKLRYDLIPPYPLEKLAEVYTIGAKKYADRNWEKGIQWGRIFAAMMRHAWAWWRGEKLDPKDGQHHLASVAWTAFALMEYEQTHPELDDRPNNSNLYPAAKSTATGIAFIEGAEERFAYYADQLVRDRLRGQDDGFSHGVFPDGPDGCQQDDATGFVDSSGEPTESTPCLGSDYR